MSAALYEPDGPDRFLPTDLARGPWDPDAQHGGAPAALLAGALAALPCEAPMAIVRLTYEFLRPVPLTPLTLRTRIARPGRRVQLLEASLHAGEDEVVQARALRIRRDDVPAPAPQPALAPPHPPQDSELLQMRPGGPPTFARDAMEIRFARGSFFEVGPSFAWFRLRCDVVAGGAPTALQRLAAAADFGNGIAAAVSWATHVFINPDLTLYVEQLPAGEWIGLDAESRLSAQGSGLSDSVLFDERGRVGRAQQALYVAGR